MIFNKRGSGLIYVMIGMTLSAIVLGTIFNFYKSFSESSSEFNKIQEDFRVVNNWLTFLQKIIFEKWKYLAFNDNGLSFTAIENSVEKTYFLKLDSCNNGYWKTLYYYNADTNVNLFSNKCIQGINSIEFYFPRPEIKEKMARIKIITENGSFFTTLFINF